MHSKRQNKTTSIKLSVKRSTLNNRFRKTSLETPFIIQVVPARKTLILVVIRSDRNRPLFSPIPAESRLQLWYTITQMAQDIRFRPMLNAYAADIPLKSRKRTKIMKITGSKATKTKPFSADFLLEIVSFFSKLLIISFKSARCLFQAEVLREPSCSSRFPPVLILCSVRFCGWCGA